MIYFQENKKLNKTIVFKGLFVLHLSCETACTFYFGAGGGLNVREKMPDLEKLGLDKAEFA